MHPRSWREAPVNSPRHAEPPASSDGGTVEIGPRARATGAIVWSGFLAAAFATMLCFAFIDPDALRVGDLPEWWTSRRRVYAFGFFLFWLTGIASATLCWLLVRYRTRDG